MNDWNCKWNVVNEKWRVCVCVYALLCICWNERKREGERERQRERATGRKTGRRNRKLGIADTVEYLLLRIRNGWEGLDRLLMECILQHSPCIFHGCVRFASGTLVMIIILFCEWVKLWQAPFRWNGRAKSIETATTITNYHTLRQGGREREREGTCACVWNRVSVRSLLQHILLICRIICRKTKPKVPCVLRVRGNVICSRSHVLDVLKSATANTLQPKWMW